MSPVLGVYEMLRRHLHSWIPLRSWDEVRRMLARMGCRRRCTTSHSMQRYPLVRRVLWYRCGDAEFRIVLFEPRGRNRPDAVYVESVEVGFVGGAGSRGEAGEGHSGLGQDGREAGGEA